MNLLYLHCHSLIFVVVFFDAEYNVAVFVTNQMTADPGATMT